MTIQEKHREFKIAFDKVDSEAYPEFLDGEIDYYLNESQDRFIKQRYGGNNIYQAGYEEIQKRTDDLKELVVSRYTNIIPSLVYQSIGDAVYVAQLNDLYSDVDRNTQSQDEYMLYVKAVAETCINENCCDWSRVKLVQQDDLANVSDDPFNSPSSTKPFIFFEDGNIYVWTAEGLEINNFLITFIKRPAQMNIGTYGGPVVECELSEYTHREIVQQAVQIALENVESPRQQSQAALNIEKIE